MFKLKDFDFKDKRVLMRVDYNVPLEHKVITDDSRIRKTLPTIEFILKKKAKQLVLVSHLGRPKGVDLEFSLRPVADKLKELLAQDVSLMSLGEKSDCKIILLENIRFEKGDESNDDALAKRLAELGDLFVFDAFGVSHREQASVTGVMRYLPSCTGLLMEKEMKFLDMKRPKKPFIAIIGGAKEDKIGVIDSLIKKVDGLIVGGVLANTFLMAKGVNIGASKFSKETLDYAKNILRKYEKKIHLPVDFILASEFSEDASSRCAGVNDDLGGWMIMDIGPYTISGYKELLSNAKTVVWAGPIGVFEWERFRRGTWDIASHLASLDITKIIGGGDSGDAIERFGLADKMTHVSTGGGASLELLSGNNLPALVALELNSKNFNK
ncbi:MAG: phosphoglycerate kinase [Candidatus Woesearchaeota archaeon]|nr:phosphoglycerate kinase [Candidatus Woesearchaeota archaeon]